MSSTPRFVALALGLCVAALAPPAVAMSAATPSQELPPFDVSATSARVGSNFTVSGEGCVPEEAEAEVEVLAGLIWEAEIIIAVSTGTPNGDGTWSLTVAVPTDAPVGDDYEVYATCGLAEPYADPIDYPRVGFTVTPAAAPPVAGRPSLTG